MAAVALLSACSLAYAQTVTAVRATLFAQGFTHPIAFVQDPSDPSRQVVAEQSGRIRLLVNGVVQATDYLDLSAIITPGGPDERGLLGFAFAPDYATSGRVFASFTDTSSNSRIARFTRSIANPQTADPTTRFDLIWPGSQPSIQQPFPNHNGGNIAFGPDGYLYVGLGDGGSGNDPFHNAQNPLSLLGKMLRLNVSVDGADPEGYDIPPGNPFVGQAGVLPEIWAFGLRNPWRWSFDDPAHGGTGALVIGDVGQTAWEEIDYEPAGAGGRNYGWRNREGAHDNITSLSPFSTPLIDPIHEFPRTEARSITGGGVYRGKGLGPGFRGRYVFGDFVTGQIWSLGLAISPSTGEAGVTGVINHTSALGVPAQNWSSFGVDAEGELYVVAYYGGQIYRLDPETPAGIDVVQNGSFASGTAGWLQFATPTPSFIVSNTSGGTFQFYWQPPPPGTPGQAVVFQQTGTPLLANAPLLATFGLGNSDNVRKRISVLIHDSDFSDLAVCTFWLPPQSGLATYAMRTHTTRAWGDATISFYAATANAQGNTSGFYQIDNVSIAYVPAQSATRTECVDPTAPAPAGGPDSASLLVNGAFGSGAVTPGWSLFGNINGGVSGGVFEFNKLTSAAPAGAILQPTGQALPANDLLTVTLDLGNSSPVRKRITAILHDNDFSDLAACTFWLPPGQPLSPYSFRLFTTKAWTNATLSVYPATVGADQWIRLDNVTLRRTPSAAITGAQCLEPGSSLDARAVAGPRLAPVATTATPLPGHTAAITETPADAPPESDTVAPRATPGGDDADDEWIADGFAQTGEPAPASLAPSWVAVASETTTHTLTRATPIDLTAATGGTLRFDSWLSATHGSRALVQISLDGVTWETVQVVAASDRWTTVEVDVAAYTGTAVQLRFVLEGVAPADAAGPDAWRLERLVLEIDAGPPLAAGG